MNKVGKSAKKTTANSTKKVTDNSTLRMSRLQELDRNSARGCRSFRSETCKEQSVNQSSRSFSATQSEKVFGIRDSKSAVKTE